jgi:hypothetical protein
MPIICVRVYFTVVRHSWMTTRLAASLSLSLFFKSAKITLTKVACLFKGLIWEPHWWLESQSLDTRGNVTSRHLYIQRRSCRSHITSSCANHVVNTECRKPDSLVWHAVACRSHQILWKPVGSKVDTDSTLIELCTNLEKLWYAKLRSLHSVRQARVLCATPYAYLIRQTTEWRMKNRPAVS